MKRLLAFILGLFVLWMIAQWPVTTRQGVNFRVRTLQIPLYVKVIEFLDRDYHYRRLAREITDGVRGEAERAEAIFRWMRAHLYAGTPEGLPVVDDHVWHVVLRGYGGDDQLADLFVTLAAYAGVPASVQRVRTPEGSARVSIALFQADGRWVPVDPYRGYWFTDAQGRLADLEAMRRDPAIAKRIVGEQMVGGAPYVAYLSEVTPPIAGSAGALRAVRQQPWRRLWLEMRQRLSARRVAREVVAC